MSLDKFREAWKAEASQIQVTFDADTLTREVQQSQNAFRSMIYWRDLREIVVALVMIPMWIVMGYCTSSPWTWYLSVPVLIWIAGFFLVDRIIHPQRASGPGEELLFYVKESLAQVEHQIWLLRNIFWWYLLPPSISLAAFFIHSTWISTGAWWGTVLLTAVPVGFVYCVYRGIYRLNQIAVRDQLEPRRAGLRKLIDQFESDRTADETDDLLALVTALSGTDGSANQCGNWAAWAENWNRIIPSWREVAIILAPTLAGAFCGWLWGLTEIGAMYFGPVFFQSVIGAVIPFLIVIFSLIFRSFQRYKDQPLSGKGSSCPNAPAVVIIAMIFLLSILAFAALMSCSVWTKSRQSTEVAEVTTATAIYALQGLTNEVC